MVEFSLALAWWRRYQAQSLPAARRRALDKTIQVDEDYSIVTVHAGVPQRMLLDYLADYT